ncbi:hypothetical protein DFJ58DRAFT_736946 [Suillus subalutaceus]|uniref:uncharacterized protein n=1 Tax=Suillus subalutaceus TaxID=48586 RepID=UPI001B875C5E|nr:uncharacterized protein DFJ58DRAFT_736946 [Suillus subalutaceus]KAG1830509.1 hypothetical protein DFJ58DRAFT_736946 [Suillus subalutaceus]
MTKVYDKSDMSKTTLLEELTIPLTDPVEGIAKMLTSATASAIEWLHKTILTFVDPILVADDTSPIFWWSFWIQETRLFVLASGTLTQIFLPLPPLASTLWDFLQWGASVISRIPDPRPMMFQRLPDAHLDLHTLIHDSIPLSVPSVLQSTIGLDPYTFVHPYIHTFGPPQLSLLHPPLVLSDPSSFHLGLYLP